MDNCQASVGQQQTRLLRDDHRSSSSRVDGSNFWYESSASSSTTMNSTTIIIRPLAGSGAPPQPPWSKPQPLRSLTFRLVPRRRNLSHVSVVKPVRTLRQKLRQSARRLLRIPSNPLYIFQNLRGVYLEVSERKKFHFFSTTAPVSPVVSLLYTVC